MSKASRLGFSLYIHIRIRIRTHILMFGPYAICFFIKVKGKIEASPAPSKNSAYIPMGFQWAQVFKDSFDKLNTEQRLFIFQF